MDLMEWAIFAVDYLRTARAACEDDLRDLMDELRGQSNARHESWYAACKNTIPHLYHYSHDVTADPKIPGSEFSSPGDVSRKLDQYRAFVQGIVDELEMAGTEYQERRKVDGPPMLVSMALVRAHHLLDAINHVLGSRPSVHAPAAQADHLDRVAAIAARFHESVLKLKKHPHGGKLWQVENEWDCQYLFASILAAVIPDVRYEEWGPSVAGSSARCEFLLKDEKILVELKYVRSGKDQKKIKEQIASDRVDYGASPAVDAVVFLIYDPQHLLPSPIALQKDLEGPTDGLKDVKIVITPPRL